MERVRSSANLVGVDIGVVEKKIRRKKEEKG
jgi:hypothetical protein